MNQMFLNPVKNQEGEEENLIKKFLPQTQIYATTLANRFAFYLSGEILDPEYYCNWFEVIRNASENDIIEIHINSYGGEAFTVVQLLNALKNTNATVNIFVEGRCMSAATFLLFAGDTLNVDEHSSFMFHTYSTGMVGKSGELSTNIAHSTEWFNNFVRSIYKDFLTEAEISSILDNKDIYMTATEVQKRVEKKVKAMLKEMKQRGKEELE